MIENIRQISLMNKIFNVRRNEWHKILKAWIVNFLYFFGFVIGWTIIVAMFVSRYGISYLPFLFVANAIFTILGSFLYSTFLAYFKKEDMLNYTIFISVAVLFSAYYFAQTNPILFFALLVVSEAVFLSQFKIILNSFTEEMFNPIQSGRTFPIIESSATIGGLVAGLTVFLFSNVTSIPNFVLIWIILILLMLPFINMLQIKGGHSSEIPHEAKIIKTIGVVSQLKKIFKKKSHIAYIKGLLLIVLLQWVLFNLLEFQYTKAVYQNVSHVVLTAGSGFEHEMTHDLGLLFVLFNSAALLIQLFLGSRLINSLGIMGSMLLHSLVTILNLFNLTFNFSFGTAVMAKTNFTITSIIHNNAYHSSYYAIKEKFREYIREFLEGIIRPVGAVLGTFVLLSLERLFVGENLILYVNISMLAVALMLFYVTYSQQAKYTNAAIEDLLNSKDKAERFNAIDILAQRGHASSLSYLSKVLLNEKEPLDIRLRILHAFSELCDPLVINDIIICFNSHYPQIKKAAVETLLKYTFLRTESRKYMVIEYKLIEALKKLYTSERNEEVRSDILTLLSRLSTIATFEFLANVLKTAKGKLKADAILALGNYDDASVLNFIKPYLNASDRRQRISAIIAAGHFKSFQCESLKMIHGLLNSRSYKNIEDAIFAIGQLKLKQMKHVCFEYLHSQNVTLRMHAAVALAKLGHEESVPILLNFILFSGKTISSKVQRMIREVDVRILKNIDRIMMHLKFNQNQHAT